MKWLAIQGLRAPPLLWEARTGSDRRQRYVWGDQVTLSALYLSGNS
jgi:hypothetical protein